MTINRLFGVLVITMGLAAVPACGKKGGDAAKKYSAVVDEVCACKDVACLQKAQEKMKGFEKPKDLSADDMKKISADAQRAMKCVQDLMKAGGAEAAGAGAAAAGGAAAAAGDQAAAAAGGDDKAAGDDQAGDDDKAAGDDDGDEGAEGKDEGGETE